MHRLDYRSATYSYHSELFNIQNQSITFAYILLFDLLTDSEARNCLFFYHWQKKYTSSDKATAGLL